MVKDQIARGIILRERKESVKKQQLRRVCQDKAHNLSAVLNLADTQTRESSAGKEETLY